MVTFTILVLILLILAVVAILAISIGGAAFIVVFGDLIVCIAIIAWLIRLRIKRWNRRRW